MTEKHGYENLEKVIMLGVEIGNVADKMLHTEGASKWANLMDLSDEVFGLPSVKWDQIDDEYKDLSDVEKDELHQKIKDKFDIADDKLEETIERSAKVVMNLHGVVMEALDLFKSTKAPDPAPVVE